MKKLTVLMGSLLLLSPALAVAATVVVDETTDTAVVQQPATQETVVMQQPATTTTVVQPAPTVVQATPVVIATQEDPREFEGEITDVEMPTRDRPGRITVHVTSGRDRKVIVKQGMISGYKVNDYVKVKLMADMKEAAMINTIRDASHIDGTIVAVDAAADQIIIRDAAGNSKTVLVTPGSTAAFRSGSQVRVFLIPQYREARLIRVIR